MTASQEALQTIFKLLSCLFSSILANFPPVSGVKHFLPIHHALPTSAYWPTFLAILRLPLLKWFKSLFLFQEVFSAHWTLKDYCCFYSPHLFIFLCRPVIWHFKMYFFEISLLWSTIILTSVLIFHFSCVHAYCPERPIF